MFYFSTKSKTSFCDFVVLRYLVVDTDCHHQNCAVSMPGTPGAWPQGPPPPALWAVLLGLQLMAAGLWRA